MKLIIKNPSLGINFLSLHPKDYWKKRGWRKYEYTEIYFLYGYITNKIPIFHAKTDVLKVIECNLNFKLKIFLVF